jgi:hypothetical protein
MADEEQVPQGKAASLLEDVVARSEARAAGRVAALRTQHPQAPKKELATRLVKSFARRAGLGGAATGALSLVSLPVGLPAGIALTLAIEAELLLSLLKLYDIDTSGTAGRVRLYALWAGSGVADAAKNLGLVWGTEAVATIIVGSLPIRIISRLHPALVRLVLRRLGLGWLPKVLKLWPLVGAPIGYVFDSTALRKLGDGAVATLESVTQAQVVTEPEAAATH